MSLWDGIKTNGHLRFDKIIGQCQEIWDANIQRYTWTGITIHTRIAMKITQFFLCFSGNGTVKVRSNLNCNVITYGADMQGGTSSLMDQYWMCGVRLHMQLPPNWYGLCSLVTLHTPTLVIPGVDLSQLHDHPMGRPTTLLHHHRTKRTAEYFGTEVWKDVPQEHKLFNDAQLFFGSILPFLQAKATACWLQVTRWELMKAINATEDGFNAIKEELRALRLMVMQHRYVLDLMTAMEGGVCRKIGSACCTYVPANDAEQWDID